MPIFTPAGTTSHPDTVPYISTDDYQNAPTAVDTTALIPGGTTQANLVELANVIRRASSWADNLCYQTLAATLDTQTCEARVRRDGTVRVHNDYWPLLELDSFTAGPSPSTMTAVVDTANIFMPGRAVLAVPVAGLVANTADYGYPPRSLRAGDRAYCQWSYWNGWPHTALAAAAAADAATLTVTAALPAAAAGRTLTIWDGAVTEQVVVAASFTGGTTVPLTAGTVYAHTLPAAPASVTVTALPDDVREAVISLTSCLIKTRGAESYEMDAVGQTPSKSAVIEGGGLEDLSLAADLLDRYRRTV